MTDSTQNTPQNRPNVLILGFGALGTLYGFLLQRGGANIYAVARSNAETLVKEGITIESAKYGTHEGFKPTGVFKTPKEVLSSNVRFDYVLCTVKNCPEEKKLGEFVKEYLRPSDQGQSPQTLPVVAFLENGIDIEQEPYEALVSGASPRASMIISCVAWLGATLRDGGRRCDHGAMDKFEMGLYPTGKPDDESDAWRREKVDAFCKLFNDGGASAQVIQDIQIQRFIKVLWNAGWGGLSLCSRQAIQELLADENVDLTEHTVRQIMLEILQIVRACGYSEEEFPSQKVEDVLQLTLSQAPKYLEKGKTGNLNKGFKPSILVDLEANRPMELTPIVGNLVNLAKKHKIDAPRLDLIYTANHPVMMQAVKAAKERTSTASAAL